MIWTIILFIESLLSQNMSPSLNNVLETVVNVVSTMLKQNLLKQAFFIISIKEMGAELTALLLRCNSRWLSKGNVLIRVFELYTCLNKDHNYSNTFIDSDFVIKLTYLFLTNLICSTHLYVVKNLVFCNYMIKLLLLLKKKFTCNKKH